MSTPTLFLALFDVLGYSYVDIDVDTVYQKEYAHRLIRFFF